MREDYYYVNNGKLEKNTYQAIRSAFKTKKEAWDDYRNRLVNDRNYLIKSIEEFKAALEKINKKLDKFQTFN